MRKLTIIRGKRGEGKTTKMLKMIKGKKSIEIASHTITHSFAWSQVEKDTEVIVVDGCSNQDLIDIIFQFKNEFMRIDKKCQDAFYIPQPDFIIVMQSR